MILNDDNKNQFPDFTQKIKKELDTIFQNPIYHYLEVCIDDIEKNKINILFDSMNPDMSFMVEWEKKTHSDGEVLFDYCKKYKCVSIKNIGEKNFKALLEKLEKFSLPDDNKNEEKATQEKEIQKVKIEIDNLKNEEYVLLDSYREKHAETEKKTLYFEKFINPEFSEWEQHRNDEIEKIKNLPYVYKAMIHDADFIISFSDGEMIDYKNENHGRTGRLTFVINREKIKVYNRDYPFIKFSHPHASSEKTPCFGINDGLQKAWVEYEIYAIVQYLRIWQTNYSHGDAYLSIEKWKLIIEKHEKAILTG